MYTRRNKNANKCFSATYIKILICLYMCVYVCIWLYNECIWMSATSHWCNWYFFTFEMFRENFKNLTQAKFKQNNKQNLNSNLCEWKNELWMERKANKTLFVRFLTAENIFNYFVINRFYSLKCSKLILLLKMCEIYAKRKYTRKWNYFEKSWYVIHRESVQQHKMNLKRKL